MTVPIPSILFVDYDSLYLSLRARDPGMARRFAARPDAWIEALESGLLATGSRNAGVERRILVRRCYADPKLLGRARTGFIAQGFQIIDCPPLSGRERNSAEVQIALDTVDTLGHASGFEEFILLSADSDLTPLILRLRAHNRSTLIYSTPMTPPEYRTLAGGGIDEADLLALLTPLADAESPETDEGEDDGQDTRPRGDLATVARRVHRATQVPLFSPKVYRALFQTLAGEIAANGYHFQATAENVAAALVASGRNTTRRQIAFVVKGLALKGHVFSSTDTPERLADVFAEQVLFLARNAGMEIDSSVETHIQTWIAGRPADIEAETAPPPVLERPLDVVGEPERVKADERPAPPPVAERTAPTLKVEPTDATSAAAKSPVPAIRPPEPLLVPIVETAPDLPESLLATPAPRSRLPRADRIEPSFAVGPDRPPAPPAPIVHVPLDLPGEDLPAKADAVESPPELATVPTPIEPTLPEAPAPAEPDIGDEIQKILAAYSQNRKPADNA